VARLLREARAAGLRLGIATTTTPENVETLIESTLGAEALDWFEVIAAGDVVPAKKPAPDVYAYALTRLGIAPASAVAFEDSAAGVRSARGAGIDTVVVTWSDYTRGQDFSGASLVLDGFGDPGVPCTRVAGELEVDGCLDLSLVRRLHRHIRGGTADP
jgi:beta-phosphoglucomutase-like phosphatase (HAD superfamily)